MSQVLKVKRSAVQGRVPQVADLQLGEIAINTYDGRIYFRKNDGSDSIVDVIGAAAGGNFVLKAGDTMTGSLTAPQFIGPLTGNVTGNVSGTSGSTTGNAATATALQTARTINGVSFDGTGNVTVTAAAGTLTGNTLASGVTASSLTSVGTLTSMTSSGTVTANAFVGPLTGTVTGHATLDLALSGGTMSGQIISTQSEAIRLTSAGAYLSGFNAAGNTRTGYLQFNSGSNVQLTAEQTNNILINTAGGSLQIATSGAATFSTTLTVNGTLQMPGSNTGIELGAPGSVNTPFIDFHSGGNTGVDYDVRLISTGGSASTGTGSLSIQAAGGVTVSGPVQGGGRGLFNKVVSSFNNAESAQGQAGDFVARRSTTSGVLYFGDSTASYLYFDGTNYNLGNGQGSAALIGPAGGFTGTLNGSITGNSTSVSSSPNRTDGTSYPVVWNTEGGTSQNYTCAAIRITSSIGNLSATSFNSGSQSNFQGSQGDVIGTSTGSLGAIMVQGNGTNAAFMSFHRPGSFAAYFGIDSDNIWKVGGWSMGAASYTLYHSGNISITPAAGAISRVVQADPNGYIFNTYFNSTDNSQPTGLTGVMVKAGDNYLRTGTAAGVAAFVGPSITSIGTIATIAGTSPANGAIRLTPNLHLNSGSANAVILNWDNGNSGTTQTVRIGNGAGADVWYCGQGGQTVQTGDATFFSDERVKADIRVIDNALDKVKQIRGVTFVRTNVPDKTRKTGVIAQEIQKVLPEVVSESVDGTLTVAYGNTIGLLIEAIKELNAKVESLQAQLDAKG